MKPLQRFWLSIALLLVAAGIGRAGAEVAVDNEGTKAEPDKTVCELIDAAADEHKLPTVFLTRLIWKESSFRPNAVSPKGAQGIAQFMPATAARRGLADPFDPVSAVPASAHYLKDLAEQFGNLGLAAAAYNAGEKRVSDWIAGARGLPLETRDYVLFITGRPAGDWKDPETASVEEEVGPAADDKDASEGQADCAEIAALLSKPGAGSARFAVRHTGEAAWAPWGVQVAGNFSHARALASYEALRRKYSALLAGHDPLVVSAVVRSRGTAPFHQVRLPFDARDEADNLCRQLRSVGGACMVMKNKR